MKIHLPTPKRSLHRGAGVVLAIAVVLGAISVRAATETELIAILQSNATAVQKAEACKELRLAGTAKAVPALALLLADERVSQAARFALEGIAAPEAAAALRAAVSQASGLLKAGVVDSLGRMRDPAAVPLLTPLLADADDAVASSTAMALGRIGGKDALTALKSARPNVAAAVRPNVLEALLLCAEESLNAGNTGEARAIYESLTGPSETEHIRVAAQAGVIRSAGRDSLARIRAALEDGDSAAQIAALQVAGEVRDANATKVLAAVLPKSPSAQRVALLALLGARGDVAALPAVREQARSPEAAVRAAAFTALGELGDTADIPLLADAATSSDASEQKAARQALALLRRGEIAAALVAQLQIAPPATQMELTRALTDRAESSVVPALLQLARSDAPATRTAALRALSNLADSRHIGELVQLLAGAADTAAREEIIGLFESLVGRSGEASALDVAPIARGLADGDLETRKGLLRISALFADERVGAVLKASLKDSDASIRDTAARALSQTRDVALLPDLLELARQSEKTNVRALAIEGAVRLATDESVNLSPEQRTSALEAVFPLAGRVEDKRRVLSGLARVPNATTFKLAEQAAADSAVEMEADLACLQIAQKLGSAQFEVVEATLTRLAAASGNANVRTNAQSMLRQLNSGWLYAGPFRQAGKECQELFDVVFPPEQGGADVTWRRAPGAGDSTRTSAVDLTGVVAGNHAVVYLKTRVYVPVPQPVVFLLGSDDGIKLWLNGDLVHAHNAVRGLTPDEDKTKGRLRQGWNDLLAKITQHTAGCGMTLHITGEDGKDVPGLRLDPRGGTEPRPDTGFTRLQLSDQFYAEGAYFADFNRDGRLDVVAGPYWFEGPDFTTRHEYRPAQTFSPREYSDNFLTYAGDLNGNGWPDIVCVPWPGKEGYWYENPAGRGGYWKRHLYYNMVGNESQLWGDVTGDGRPELIFNNEGYLGYAGPDPANPTQPWVFHAVSNQDKRYQRYTHGLGFGDINGNGRMDIVESAGWWEHPADAKPEEPWKFHPFQFAAGGAQMLVYDVDGDGLADIITAWHCHQYGLLWWKQIARTGGSPDWKRHVILPPKPDLKSPDLRISQLHALDLVDMNGDGLKDIVTGKRFWAHGPAGDPEPNAPAVLYWFELRRDAGGKVTYIPHLIDNDSGVGTQVATADLNGDGRPDVIVANKKGIFLHLSHPRRQADASVHR